MHWAIEEFKRNPMITSGEKPHIITTNIEHCATELPLQHWAEMNLIGRIRNKCMLFSRIIFPSICKYNARSCHYLQI